MKLIITVSQLYFQNIDAPIEIPILRDLARSPGTTGKALAKAVGVRRSALSAAVRIQNGQWTLGIHGAQPQVHGV